MFCTFSPLEKKTWSCHWSLRLALAVFGRKREISTVVNTWDHSSTCQVHLIPRRDDIWPLPWIPARNSDIWTQHTSSSVWAWPRLNGGYLASLNDGLKPHEILMFFCLQKDAKQCSDATKMGCTYCSGRLLSATHLCGIIALLGIFFETKKHQNLMRPKNPIAPD